jgi:hypothetical protein
MTLLAFPQLRLMRGLVLRHNVRLSTSGSKFFPIGVRNNVPPDQPFHSFLLFHINAVTTHARTR